MGVDPARARELLGEEVRLTYANGRAIIGQLKHVEEIPVFVVEAPDGARHRATGLAVERIERADA